MLLMMNPPSQQKNPAPSVCNLSSMTDADLISKTVIII